MKKTKTNYSDMEPMANNAIAHILGGKKVKCGNRTSIRKSK